MKGSTLDLKPTPEVTKSPHMGMGISGPTNDGPMSTNLLFHFWFLFLVNSFIECFTLNNIVHKNHPTQSPDPLEWLFSMKKTSQWNRSSINSRPSNLVAIKIGEDMKRWTKSICILVPRSFLQVLWGRLIEIFWKDVFVQWWGLTIRRLSFNPRSTRID